ncbi:MAG: hypothetical protein ABTQ34_08815 [Bdellovibrionales bacterium]
MSGSNQPDPIITLALLFGVLIIGALVFWHFFGDQVLYVLGWLRYGELFVVNLFSGQYNSCLDWLLLARPGVVNTSNQMITLSQQCFGASYLGALPRERLLDYFAITGYSLATIESMVGYYLRIPLALAFGGMWVYIIYYSPRNKFRTKHNLESFIKVQSKTWPVILPIVNFNPMNSSARIPGSLIPDKLPMFAEALSPEEWISYHRIPVTNGIADREAARRAFLLQLGPRWNGTDDLPNYMQALFAAFCLKGVQKRDESDTLLGKLAPFWSEKGGFVPSAEVMDEARHILKKPAVGGKGLEVAVGFAYRTTALLGTLKWARASGGVLAPAQFLWLRGTDRTLWYALNNLGRRSFHAEGAGAMAHFMAEQNARKPLPIPRVDTAIVTLNQFLASSGQPIPPREGDPVKAT